MSLENILSNKIDKIFCITLNTSTDRQKLIKERFPDLTNSPLFEWYITERDSENSERGCYNSHKNVIDIAKSRSYKKIIIFEDDVDLIVTYSEFVKEVLNVVDVDFTWSIILLGYFPVSTEKTKYSNLYAIDCALGTHGYMVNLENFKTIDNFKNCAIDQYLFCKCRLFSINKMKSIDGIFGIYPMLLKQNSKTSTIGSIHDISGNLNYDRNLLIKVSTQINICVLFFIILLCLLACFFIIFYNIVRFFHK